MGNKKYGEVLPDLKAREADRGIKVLLVEVEKRIRLIGKKIEAENLEINTAKAGKILIDNLANNYNKVIISADRLSSFVNENL